MIVATHTWANGSNHPKSEWHFYEQLNSYNDAKDRAFGVPVCVSHKIEQGEVVKVETTSDDVRAVIRIFDYPKPCDCCRSCRNVVVRAGFPKSTRGELKR